MYSDSILLAVSNIQVFKGNYEYLDDKTLHLTIKRLAHVDTIPFQDTLKVSGGEELKIYYKGQELKVDSKLVKDGLLRFNQIENE